MPSQIRPNRLEVSDRFPMLGFTIRTDGDSKRYEVVIAAEASLFRPDAKLKRTRANFYSSRAIGLQPIDRGESVYVLPPEVLARFVGQEKLFYALATYANGGKPEITALPSEGSAYINLKGFSGRSLSRVRVLPSRQRAAATYGSGAGSELEWAGDAAMPGTQPVAASPAPSPAKTNGNTAAAAPPTPTGGVQATALDYNDGWGPMPPATQPHRDAAATCPQPTVRAQANQSFSINWDELELIPQPTDATCWAASAAMVIGWRDQVSLTPELIAEIAGRSTATGLNQDERRKFAGEVGLQYDEPKSYGIDAFANLLETSGPLWVSVRLPNSGHAIVVTGMYSDGAEDGSDTYVRITDPWDRVVGKPGAPGKYLSTHNTGSRYILSWADFMSEYEARASSASDGTVNAQILYAARKPNDDRQPRRSGAKDYAMAAAAYSLADDIPLDPGVGGMSIGPDALEIGDIILSTTGQIISRAIRTASNAQVSHSMLYVGQGGQVIEAVGSGVRLIPLAQAIEPATVAVAFRLPGLSDEQKQQIADAAADYIGKDYDFVGIARQAGFQIHSRVCNMLPESEQENCRQWVGRVYLGTETNDQFFCSALIIAAYDKASAPLTSTPPRWTSPGDLAEIALRRGALAYVGHLKAPPLVHSQSVYDVSAFGGAGQATNGSHYGRARALEDVSSLAPEEDQGIEEGVPASPDVSSEQAYTSAMAAPPDYPQASRYAPAASVNYRASSGQRSINRVVIHITDGGANINGTVGWFQNPNQTNSKGKPIHVSAHYVVGQNGEVVQMVRDNDVAWHASSANGDSIGIEHVANTRGLMPTQAEYCASAALTRWLCDTYSIPIDRTHILGHAEADTRTSHTNCPNAVWNWDYYMGLVKTASCYAMTPASGLSTNGQSNGYENGYEQEKLPPPPPLVRAHAMGVVEIVSAVAGAVMEKIINRDGSITWELEQLRGLKHPNDTAPSPAQAFHDAPTILLNDWPYLDAAKKSRLSAWFSVDWQFNGKSLGNVQIANIGTDGALLRELHVEARIMDDNILYPADNPTYAALRIRFNYRFNRALGSDYIAITELHLYGNGTFDKTSRWEQS
jgi:N-acetyl-anhydromuramyl-L-alanine amidase AmpD/uncharacterized protein YycO